MELRSLGYVGQNLTKELTTGRTLRLANLSAERVAQVTAANLADLRSILEWNVEHGIRFFRIGSSIVPFASHPDFDLDWQERFAKELAEIRSFAERHEIRLSMHPGQYTVLNSPREQVVSNSVAELEYHAAFLAAVAPNSGTMTLHVGGAYGDREEALERFVTNGARLSEQALGRLSLENDDVTFGIDEVLHLCRRLQLPAVFDFHHHRLLHRRSGWREELHDLLLQVIDTWGERPPKFHLSSARDEGRGAHADYISPEDLATSLALLADIPSPQPFDLMLEAKAKEKAVLLALEWLEVEAG